MNQTNERRNEFGWARFPLSCLESSSAARRLATVAICALLSLGSGCANKKGILGVDRFAEICPGAIPPPPGTKVCQWQTAQVNNALTDQNVLYQADFVGRSTELSPAALERLSRHAESSLASTLPWIIEPSGDDELDAGRLESVAGELAIRGVPSPEIQIALPAALGLSGPQAERVAGSLGTGRNSIRGTGAPISQPTGLSGIRGGFLGGF